MTSRHRSLLRDARGGTDFVQALMMIALIAFFAVVGVRLFGDAVASKFAEQTSNVVAIGDGAAGHTGSIPAPSTPGAHTPGPTTPGSAPTSPGALPAPGAPAEAGAPWPDWATPIIRWGPAALGASPLAPLVLHDYYTTGVSIAIGGGVTGDGVSAGVGVTVTDPDAPATAEVGVSVTDPDTWLLGATAAQAVVSGAVDNTSVEVSAPVPTGLVKKVLRKVLSAPAVDKVVKAFPEIEGHLIVAIENGIRSGGIGVGGTAGPDSFQVGVGAHAFAAEDGSFGVDASITLTELGRAEQSFTITVTARPRDIPLHEQWLRDRLAE